MTALRWTRVAPAVQTSSPVASVIVLVVRRMSVPSICRSPVTLRVALSSSPTTIGRS